MFFFSNNTTAVKRENKSRWKLLANRRHKSNQLRETRVSSKHGETVSEGTLDEGEVIAENADVEDDNNADVEDENADVEGECTGSQGSMSQFISDGEIVDTTAVHDGSSIDSDSEQDIPVANQDKGLITDVDSIAWESLMQQMSAQQELIGMLKSELKVVISPAAKMEGDDDQTHFYTGLPSYAVFSSLLDLLLSVMSKRTSHRLSPQDQFLLVLMKLKLAVPSKDLGYRFSISPARVSQIFHELINIMSQELKQLIKWPDRELI